MIDYFICKFDERRHLAFPGTHDNTIAFAVSHFISVAQNAIENHDAFFVALSGGSTPQKIFQELALPHNREAIDWSRVYLFWSDERAVPPDHADSNYKMAMDSGLSKLPLKKEHIFRMQAETNGEKHALEYEKIIKETLHGADFDLIMLGMGEDGHTASLFPHTKALEISHRLVVINEVPQKKTYRMTFTFPLINSAHNIVVYVLGKEKAARLKEVFLDDPMTLPSSHVGTDNHPALWIIDDAAGKELLSCWKPYSHIKMVS